MRRMPAAMLFLAACNRDPGHPEQGVTYRDPIDTGAQSGERGTVVMSEVFWSGSVDKDGNWDPTDVFIELRNEGSMPVDLSGWLLVQEGTITKTFRIPTTDVRLDVGEHAFAAKKTTGCFPEPDYVIPDLVFPTNGDPFEVTLYDFDEHLIEPAGRDDMRAFAGGYDGVRSRSMERVELMFGGEGSDPHMWHYYTPAEVDVPNNDRIAENCRTRTLASPGRANSPDYSGAFASGSLE